jgi:hypothetical protein
MLLRIFVFTSNHNITIERVIISLMKEEKEILTAEIKTNGKSNGKAKKESC